MWEWRGGEGEGNAKTGQFCGSGDVEREREILKQVSFVGVERWRGRGKYKNRLVLWEWRGGEAEGNTKTGLFCGRERWRGRGRY